MATISVVTSGTNVKCIVSIINEDGSYTPLGADAIDGDEAIFTVSGHEEKPAAILQFGPQFRRVDIPSASARRESTCAGCRFLCCSPGLVHDFSRCARLCRPCPCEAGEVDCHE